MNSVKIDREAVNRLGSFTRDYLGSYLQGMRCLKGIPSWFDAETDRCTIWLCSDGAVSFYKRLDPASELERGVVAMDAADCTLNELCQTFHIHRLQFLYPPLGTGVDDTYPTRQDVPRVERLSSATQFDPVVREYILRERPPSLTGVSITPIIRWENGLRKSYVPGRVQVWSPIIRVPGVGPRRLFGWSHADFWWGYQKLPFDGEMAREFASLDLLALQIVLSAGALEWESASTEPTSVTAADILDGYCQELQALIDEPGTSEEVMHQWLAEERHRVFLDQRAESVWSKLAFGKNESDFVIRHSDGTYTLIEIERPATPIIRGGNSEPSAQFHHACQQVRDWQRYVRDNVSTVLLYGRSLDSLASTNRRAW
jgi:hypothetical protein